MAGIALGLGGGFGQVLVAERYAGAGAAAVPVAGAGAVLVCVAAVLLGGSRGAGGVAGWIAAGAALTVAAGAWALLPGAWFVALLGWRRRDAAELIPAFLAWYLAGVALGVGLWAAFVGVR